MHVGRNALPIWSAHALFNRRLRNPSMEPARLKPKLGEEPAPVPEPVFCHAVSISYEVLTGDDQIVTVSTWSAGITHDDAFARWQRRRHNRQTVPIAVTKVTRIPVPMVRVRM